MNLLLWRHAEAEDGADDLARALTPRGRRQADKVAHWLGPRLPARRRLLASPAVRAVQTARALGDDVQVDARLAPGADVHGGLLAAGWPGGGDDTGEAGGGTVIVVGHQPTLGRIASRLMCGAELDWSVRKGAVWWLAARRRDGLVRVVLRAIVDPQQL